MSTINIADVRVNGGTQSRTKIDLGVVSDYAEAMREGATFPPIVVFFDGTDYWLADGFHRYRAYSDAQIYDVPVDIRQGTQRDAILFSVGANAAHGLRRTDADKRQAILVLLADEEWGHWSNREIARQCAVSPVTVARVKEDVAAFHRGEARDDGGKYRPGREVVFNSHEVMKIPTVHVDSERTYTTKHGTTATMQTANIGASSKADQIAPEPETPVVPEVVAPEPAPASNADQGPAEPIDPAEAKERREIARMPDEAKADEIIGLRADLRDEKAKNARLKKERDDLSSRLAEALATDQGRTISLLQKQLQAAKFSRDEAMSSAKRMEYRLKKAEARVKELESMEVSFP